MLNDRREDYDVGNSHPGISLNLLSTPFVGKGSMYFEDDGKYNSAGDSDSGEQSDAVQYSDDDNTSGSDDEECDEYGPESMLTRVWLRLTGEALPIVPVVTRFSNDNELDFRKMRLFKMVWPPSWSIIASCLPNVEAISIYACDDERRDGESRRAARDG